MSVAKMSECFGVFSLTQKFNGGQKLDLSELQGADGYKLCNPNSTTKNSPEMKLLHGIKFPSKRQIVWEKVPYFSLACGERFHVRFDKETIYGVQFKVCNEHQQARKCWLMIYDHQGNVETFTALGHTCIVSVAPLIGIRLIPQEHLRLSEWVSTTTPPNPLELPQSTKDDMKAIPLEQYTTESAAAEASFVASCADAKTAVHIKAVVSDAVATAVPPAAAAAVSNAAGSIASTVAEKVVDGVKSDLKSVMGTLVHSQQLHTPAIQAVHAQQLHMQALQSQQQAALKAETAFMATTLKAMHDDVKDGAAANAEMLCAINETTKQSQQFASPTATAAGAAAAK